MAAMHSLLCHPSHTLPLPPQMPCCTITGGLSGAWSLINEHLHAMLTLTITKIKTK